MTGTLPVHDVRRARSARGLLAVFNAAGVLVAADVHVAMRLWELAGTPAAPAEPNDPGPDAEAPRPAPAATDGADPEAEAEAVRLACALAVRAPRLGHVCTDLATVAGTATTEADEPVDLAALPWPEPGRWLAALRASPLVGGPAGDPARPLRLVGTRLYLDRCWREEDAVARDLRERAGGPAADVDLGLLRSGLDRLLPLDGDADPEHGQRSAAATAVLRPLAVVSGGPGTGKTSTVARILALLGEQALAAGRPLPRVALAAPTGKAAARLEAAVHEAAAAMTADGAVDPAVAAHLGGLRGSTVHRLLGWRPGSTTRFRHHRGDHLPHDVVVVDETSMVALTLMARLVEAVRPTARLLLAGDHEQLASVEAGAVLGDLVGPAAAGLRLRPPARAAVEAASGVALPATDPPATEDDPAIGDGIVVLHHVFRHRGAIAALARAVQSGDADAAVAVLHGGADDAAGPVRFLEVDLAEPSAVEALEPVRTAVVAAGVRVVEAAERGDAPGALAALGTLRLLCAHRRGPAGVATWEAHVGRWLAAAIPGYGLGGRWYVGRPLLVTANDPALRLHNGDTGVVVARDGGVRAAFPRGTGHVEVAPTRLAAVEGVHATTVHKSQGSQFAEAAVLLPDADSPLLTRELLYTAVTRAVEALTVVGTEAAVRAAVTRPVGRASGLRAALWGAEG